MKFIEISNGSFAIVSDEDYDNLAQYTWTSHNCGYASRRVFLGKRKYKTIYMHREVVNAPRGMEVDHKDGNRLNNQRDNLRLATKGQNQCNQNRLKSNNTSGFVGVVLDKRNNTWYSQITINNKVITVGSGFQTKEQAAICRNVHAAKAYGEFAKLNPIP